MNGQLVNFSQVDSLNLAAIEQLEKLNIFEPSQTQIDAMETLITRLTGNAVVYVKLNEIKE